MERGWRRSGTYYYKPLLDISCCRSWTHRMDSALFKLKKDQRKTIKAVQTWLKGFEKGEKMDMKAEDKNKKHEQQIPQNQIK